MASLYQKLSKIGLKQNYVRKNGLPSWWDDELNDKPVAVLEGAGYIAKNLNLDLSSLLNPQEEVKFKQPKLHDWFTKQLTNSQCANQQSVTNRGKPGYKKTNGANTMANSTIIESQAYQELTTNSFDVYCYENVPVQLWPSFFPRAIL